jgi:hypothetical protein
MKEYKANLLSKLIQTSFGEYNVEFNGEIIGTVVRRPRRDGWKAISAAGRYIGATANKNEAKLWVVGETTKIEYKN